MDKIIPECLYPESLSNSSQSILIPLLFIKYCIKTIILYASIHRHPYMSFISFSFDGTYLNPLSFFNSSIACSCVALFLYILTISYPVFSFPILVAIYPLREKVPLHNFQYIQQPEMDSYYS